MVGFYLLIAALSFLALYFSLKKLSVNIDEKSLLEPVKIDIYPKFCDIIDLKISELKTRLESGNLSLKESKTREDFLEKLGDLSRELTFIQTMNLSNKNDATWQSELFSFLKELENLLSQFLENAEVENDNLREILMQEFQNLKA